MSGSGKQMCLFVAAGIMLLCSLYYGNHVKQFAGTMSVKYQDSGLSCAQIDRLHEITEMNKKEEVPYVTGWDKKEEIKIENEGLGSEASVNLLKIHGDMSEVIPQTLLFGSYVEKEDMKGCVISLNTAEKLFRCSQVIGCEVTYQKKQYIIRGVLKSEEDILMVQTEGESKFPYLELCYEREDYAASNTKAFLNLQGLHAYDSYTEGNFYAGIAGIFMGIPFFILLILFIRAASGKIQKEERTVLHCLKIGLITASAAFALIIIIKCSVSFSDDFIPSKISDFEFWLNKYREVRHDYKLMLQYQTWYKESIIIGNLRNCIVTSWLSGILCIAAELSGGKMRE